LTPALAPRALACKFFEIALLDYGIKKEVKNMSAFNKDDDDEFAGLPEEEEDVDGDGTTYCYLIIHSY
jgi:hypothetical protein